MMKKTYLRVFCTILFACCYSNIYAQTDEDNSTIAAASLLNTVGKCDAAIIKLDGVTGQGKRSAPYLLVAARAHDCKAHTPEAIAYYRKYLQLTSNDSVKHRLAILSTAKQGNEEQLQASTDYKKLSGAKRKTATVDRRFFEYALGGMLLAGENPKPYGLGIKYCADFGFSVLNKKAVLLLNIEPSIYFSPQKAWYAYTAGVPEKNIDKLERGLGIDLAAAMPYLFINTKKMALGVGPLAGFRVAQLHNVSSIGNPEADIPNAAGMVVGVEGLLYIGALALTLDYSYFRFKSEPVDIGLPEVNANLSTIGLKVGYRRWR